MTTKIKIPNGAPRSVHTDQVHKLFAATPAADAFLPESGRFVFICYTNRSGSNHLADLLHATGRLNRAEEALNWEEIARVSTRFKLRSLGEYLAKLLEWNTRSGWLITKLGTGHFGLLLESGLLDQCFARAKFIHIVRNDLLGQAISYDIALQTDQWASFQNSRIPPEGLHFSADRISSHIEQFRNENLTFAQVFEANEITPMRVSYEALLTDAQGVLTGLAPLFGFETLVPEKSRATLSRQSSKINDIWRGLYLDHSSDPQDALPET